MPIIASHHSPAHPLSKDTDFVPSCDWPEDCTVQWGGRGVVISDKSNYSTAFFEAFPNGPGFFRGEGADIGEAERNCFKRYIRFTQCAHLWGRGSYLNGGTICRKCGSFATMMKPVTKLGSFRDPISLFELTQAAEGALRPSPYASLRDRQSSRYSRRAFLRMRLAGIDLPETPDTPGNPDIFADDNDDPYIVACRAAVCAWYRENYRGEETPRGGMAGLFEAFEHRSLQRILQEEEDYRSASLAPPGPEELQ